MRQNGKNHRAARNSQLPTSQDLPRNRFGDLERAESLARLERLSDVRPSVVARGRALIANPNYPDKKILRRIAWLLVGKLQP
jgi:hypothetical protein